MITGMLVFSLGNVFCGAATGLVSLALARFVEGFGKLMVMAVGRTTLYRMEKAGRFPRSTYISPNRRVWFADQIVAWQKAVDEFNPNRGRGKGRHRVVSG